MYQLKSISANELFELLTEDWRESIAPYWHQYKDDSKVFGLFDKDSLLAGGIVFSSCSPDMLYNEKEAANWFEKGYLYIGYVFVDDTQRGKGLGSLWLQELIKKFPNQKYWLTVEEEGLISFYQKNGFQLIKTLLNGNSKEWLLVYNR